MRPLAAWLPCAAAVLAVEAQAQAAPAAWVEFARDLGQRVAARFARSDDPVAERLHAFLDARVAANPDAPPPSVVARVWVGPGGAITRAEFASLGEAGADADLRAILLGLAPGPAPPPDLAQPISLRLALAAPA